MTFFLKVSNKTQPLIQCTGKQKLYVYTVISPVYPYCWDCFCTMYHQTEPKLRSTFGCCHADCVLHCLHIIKFPSVRENTSSEMPWFQKIVSLCTLLLPWNTQMLCSFSCCVQPPPRCTSLMVTVEASLLRLFHGHLRKDYRMRPCQDSGRPFQKLLFQRAKW